jgi:hypothetical protein
MIQQPRVRTKTYGDKRFDKTASTFPASSTTKTGRHDIAEILLKMALKHQKIKSNRQGARATANRAHALRRHCLRIRVRVHIALYYKLPT